MEVLVAVEPRLFQLFHAETALVAVPVQRVHVMKAPPRVGQPLASQRNMKQEIRLTWGHVTFSSLLPENDDLVLGNVLQHGNLDVVEPLHRDEVQLLQHVRHVCLNRPLDFR